MGVFLTNFSLEGSRPSVVTSVEKHGSHDQSSHNPKKGGGGGGGGSSTASRGERQDIMDKKIDAAKEDIANRIKGAESMRGRSRDVNPDVAEAHIDGLVAGYTDAAKLIGEKGRLVELRRNSNMSIPPLPSGAAELSEFTNRAKAKGFAEAVEQVSNRYSDLDNDLGSARAQRALDSGVSMRGMDFIEGSPGTIMGY